jgi:hypothetical protein
MQLRLRPFVVSLVSFGLIAALAAQSAFADPRDFTLVNGTSVALTAIFVAPATSADWEEDLLGSDMLPAGSSLAITFPDDDMTDAPRFVGSASTEGQAAGSGTSLSNCVYNIKVIGAQGETGYLYAVDLCTASTVTFSDVSTGGTTQ